MMSDINFYRQRVKCTDWNRFIHSMPPSNPIDYYYWQKVKFTNCVSLVDDE